MTTIAEVRLWGRTIGAVSLAPGETTAAFQYVPEFIGSGIQVSPLHMPLSSQIYRFPGLSHHTFHGLPGLLSDSLPDRYGQALIDAWLASQGRSPRDFNAVERLCYVGTRGMGALEFQPSVGPSSERSRRVAVDRLVELANQVLQQRDGLRADLTTDGLEEILRVGTSAGGARAKAVIAWNPATNEVRSGQVTAGDGFEYWLLKFDGVAGNRDRELDDPQGYGAVEYAYYLMATAAGIHMSPCRLFEEHGRRHFMTRRFDRDTAGRKLHVQTLGALAHFDYNLPGVYSYEAVFQIMRQLELDSDDIEQMFRRVAFNILARNQDDHVKNIALIMNQRGQWSLSPAYDVTYSYNPNGAWTATHQMTLSGKRDGFELADFREAGRIALLKRGQPESIVRQVANAIRCWPEFAEQAQIPTVWRDQIAAQHRLAITT